MVIRVGSAGRRWLRNLGAGGEQIPVGPKYAGTFDGSTDYIDVTGLSFPSGTARTFCVRAKSTQSGTGKFFFDCSSPRTVFAFVGANAGQLGYYDGSAWHDLGDNQDDGDWHTYVYVVDGTTARCYVDGVVGSDVTVASTSWTTMGTTVIGQSYLKTSNEFQGQMCDIRIYDSALNSTQATAYHNNNLTDEPYEAWDLNEGDGTAIRTSVPGGSEGILTAGSTTAFWANEQSIFVNERYPYYANAPYVGDGNNGENSNVAIPTSGSITAKILYKSVASSYHICAALTGSNWFALGIDSANDRLLFNYKTTAAALDSGNNYLVDGKYYEIVVNWDGNDIDWTINGGDAQADTISSGSLPTDTLGVGCRVTSSALYDHCESIITDLIVKNGSAVTIVDLDDYTSRLPLTISDIELFSVQGQSNAEGAGGAAASSNTPPRGTSFEIETDGTITNLQDPVGGATNASAWPNFCTDYNASTGKKIAIVEQATGASSMIEASETSAGNNWDTTGNLRGPAIAETRRAMYRLAMRGANVTQKGVLWSQGETDALAINSSTIDKEDYKHGYEDWIAAYQTEFPGAHFYISQTGTDFNTPANDTPGYEDVREAQTEIAIAGTTDSGRKGVKKAYNFDGTNDYINLDSALNTGTTGSVCFWAASTDTGWGTFGNTGSDYWFFRNASTIFTRAGTTGGFISVAHSQVADWTHYAITRSGTTIKIYVDGSELTSGTLSTSDDSTFQEIGALSGSYLTGKKSDCRVYDKELSADEITYIYSGEASGTNPGSSNLIGHWKCEDSHHEIAYDSSGNGNHGTKTNITASSFHYQGDDVPYSFSDNVGYTPALYFDGTKSFSNTDANGEVIKAFSFWTFIGEEINDSSSISTVFAANTNFNGAAFGAVTGTLTGETFTVLGGDGSGRVALTDTFSVGIHHFLCNFTGSTWDIYHNGTSKSTISTGTPTACTVNASGLYVGARQDESQDLDHQSLWDIRFYSDTLTSTEITSIYNKEEVTDHLIAHYKCDGPIEGIVTDSSSNGYHGTLNNGLISLDSIPRDESDTSNDISGKSLEHTGAFSNKEVHMCFTGAKDFSGTDQHHYTTAEYDTMGENLADGVETAANTGYKLNKLVTLGQ